MIIYRLVRSVQEKDGGRLGKCGREVGIGSQCDLADQVQVILPASIRHQQGVNFSAADRPGCIRGDLKGQDVLLDLPHLHLRHAQALDQVLVALVVLEGELHLLLMPRQEERQVSCEDEYRGSHSIYDSAECGRR
jgi:hypothetical protein